MLGFGAARELQEKLAAQEKRIRELEDELALETTWAEGEIEFWQMQCEVAENELDEQRYYNEILQRRYQELEATHKPFWKWIFS